jgi:hypothetical protein
VSEEVAEEGVVGGEAEEQHEVVGGLLVVPEVGVGGEEAEGCAAEGAGGEHVEGVVPDYGGEVEGGGEVAGGDEGDEVEGAGVDLGFDEGGVVLDMMLLVVVVSGVRDCSKAYSSILLALQFCVEFLVARGEDGVLSRIHLHGLVPSRPRPARAGSVHVSNEVGIVGDQEVWTDPSGRA